jgi:hypothetical protein
MRAMRVFSILPFAVVLAACSSSEGGRQDGETFTGETARTSMVSEAVTSGPPSCAASGSGTTTCGSGETGQKGAKHESCCTSIALPNGGAQLDKYQVTAGRMHAFIVAVKGDVRDWYASAKGTLRADAVAQIDPYASYLPTGFVDVKGDDWANAYEQLGAYIYLVDQPSSEQGCWVGTKTDFAFGAHTYPTPQLPGLPETRQVSNARLFEKPLNCVPYPLGAAFCAWDGGRLETSDEHDAAWGSGTYPWGASPTPGGYMMVNNQWTLVDFASGPNFGQACPTCDTTHANAGYDYEYPVIANPWDYSVYISAPGRFPLGAGPLGHADTAGDLMEITATTNGSSTATTAWGTKVTETDVRWSKNGSWEVHPIGYAGFSFPFMTKYGKAGIRCAR